MGGGECVEGNVPRRICRGEYVALFCYCYQLLFQPRTPPVTSFKLAFAFFCICNRMRPSTIKDKFSRVFSKFSQNYPSRVATRAICENFENTSGNLSLILRGLNAITCL